MEILNNDKRTDLADLYDFDFLVYRTVAGKPDKELKLRNEVEDRLLAEPKNHYLWYILGHIHYCSNRFKAAVKCFRKCIALEKSVRKYYMSLAFAYRRIGEYEKSDILIYNIGNISQMSASGMI